jgi:hypothetical protein
MASVGSSSVYVEAGSVTTLTRTISVTAGSRIAVFAGSNNDARTFTCADSQTNTYTDGPTATGSGSRQVVSWRAVAASTGSVTITVTISAAATNCWMAAIEIVDGVFSASGAQSNAVAATTHHCADATGVTVPDGAVVVAAAADWSGSPGTVTQASGYTALANSQTATPPALVQVRDFTTGTTSHRASFTSTNSVSTGAVLMVFAPPAAVTSYVTGGWFGR